MAKVNFSFDGIKTEIQCLKEDKMKNICIKYASKIDKDINSLYFLYNGNKINYELTYYKQANSIDKRRLEMNILVFINGDLNLKKELKQNINRQNSDNLYDNFDIMVKKPILIINVHKNSICCSTVLNDGRIATSSYDKSIIIYNNKTFKPDLIIKEHTGPVYYILLLSSGMLASCSNDKTIKIFNIKNNNYEVLQTLNYHKYSVFKIIELRNKKLVSCSSDSSIIVYSKYNNNKYTKDYQISTNGSSHCVIQTKDNEICYYENNKYSICFFDLLERKIINNINKIIFINVGHGYNFFNMITKDLLLITGTDKLYIINVIQHNLIRIINVPDSWYINVSCMLNKNTILTGGSNGKIKQWRIEKDNLKLISTKENAHHENIFSIIKLGDGHILSGSEEGIIKIW